MANPTAQPARVAIGHIRRAGWERVSHGVHVAGSFADSHERLGAVQRVLPASAAFTHLSGARLLNWWLPELPAQTPVFVQQPCDATRTRRRGILVDRHQELPHPLMVDGCRVAAPAEILLAAARDMGVLDLVLMGDSALRHGHCTPDDLAQAAAQRRRGAPRLRRVLPLLDARSESPWESVMRVLHVAAGIPVTPQYEVVDADGSIVARADLRIEGLRRLHEYDGVVHRSAQQQSLDLERLRHLTALGWDRVGFTKSALLHRAGAIIRQTDEALGRAFEPARVRAWNALLRDSTLTPQGKTRVAARWARAFR